MEFLYEYGLFLAKVVTFLVAFIIILIAIAALRMRDKHKTGDGHIEVKHLNDKLNSMRDSLQFAVLDKFGLKQVGKEQKEKDKADAKIKKQAAKAQAKQAKAAKDAPENQPHETEKKVYVIDFQGDIKASAVDNLREEITALLTIAKAEDEVVLRLESGGGMVHSYGLAASQLKRIKDRDIKLSICVDKVAASGGYMMACIADELIAAPFAVIGSIGVMAQLPNFHRLLKKHDVDFELLTAGEHKRTLTMLGENTDKGREKFMEDLEDTHVLFKDFVRTEREVVDIDQVATGEVWFGSRALERKLVDKLQTSDECINQHCDSAQVYEIKYVQKKPLQERIGMAAQAAVDKLLLRWYERATNKHYYQ